MGYPGQGPAYITNVNYPTRSPSNLALLNVVTCPTAHNIRVSIPVKEDELEQQCDSTFLEIVDPYKVPRKTWRFCKFSPNGEEISSTFIQSYLNILKVRQVTGNHGSGLLFKLEIFSVRDEDTALKVNQMERELMNDPRRRMTFENGRTGFESPVGLLQQQCDENLCFNGGRCSDSAASPGGCVCTGHFTGRHCLETACDARPCLNGGICGLTATGFACKCPTGFGGTTCRKRVRPCSRWPCGRHGICEETTDDNEELEEGFKCMCHLWWTGT